MRGVSLLLRGGKIIEESGKLIGKSGGWGEVRDMGCGKDDPAGALRPLRRGGFGVTDCHSQRVRWLRNDI